VKLIDARGSELALSAPYRDRKAAVRGIDAFREIAATAVIKDHTSTAPSTRPAPTSLQGNPPGSHNEDIG
jgi:hypothetical protein